MTPTRLGWLAAFVATIVAANVATNALGLVHWFGITATAGTWLAGLCFVFRDQLNDVAGRGWILSAIALGAALSYAFGTGRIALASGVAFALSESVDWLVYARLRQRGYTPAALASNTVGAVVDSAVFLWIAGFAVWANLPGQVLVKLLVTCAAVGLVVVTNALSRNPREGARA